MAYAQAGRGDLPTLLDTLTVAVTTLDSVGVEEFEQLYLYVVGTTAEREMRDLRLEEGQLVVGPTVEGTALPRFLEQDFEVNRRALLLADLCYIMRIWEWSPTMMAAYLRIPQPMLSLWIGRSTCVDVPALPRVVIERMKRLSIIDQTRFLSGISDRDVPRRLSMRRESFGGKTIEQILLGGHPASYVQVVLWSLNQGQPTPTIH